METIRNSTDFTKLQNILADYKGKEGSLIPILQRVQKEYGYISPAVVEYIADDLQLTPSQVYGVITFYAQFKTSPCGKNIIRVCRGTACHVRGSKSVLEAIKRNLGIKEGETTKDFKFTIEIVSCLGACALAPVMIINSTYYGKMTPQKVEEILNQF